MPEVEPLRPPVAESVPEAAHSLTPHLVVPDVEKAIRFYQEAFGAELGRLIPVDGNFIYGEIRMGDSLVILSPQDATLSTKAPQAAGGTCGGLMVYVQDVDAAFERAIEAGAKKIVAVDDTFWGDRYGQVEDPYGHRWSLATQQYELSDEEIERRAEAWRRAMAAGREPPPFGGGKEAESFKPEEYFTVTPSLVVTDPNVLEFYEQAFGAERRDLIRTPDGELMHAEMRIGDSILILTGEHPETDAHMRTPKNLDALPFDVMLYVEDADAKFEQAVQAGGEASMPVSEMSRGSRIGAIVDPAGHGWMIATDVDDSDPPTFDWLRP